MQRAPLNFFEVLGLEKILLNFKKVVSILRDKNTDLSRARDFPRPIYSAPSQFKNEQMLLKNGVYHFQFLALYFGENFMKIQTEVLML